VIGVLTCTAPMNRRWGGRGGGILIVDEPRIKANGANSPLALDGRGFGTPQRSPNAIVARK
jgi:hypothetical protein